MNIIATVAAVLLSTSAAWADADYYYDSPEEPSSYSYSSETEEVTVVVQSGAEIEVGPGLKVRLVPKKH